MQNKFMTVKERNLLKGAIRRVFSRSDLRRQVLEKAGINHQDPERPRVNKWGECACCHKPSALYQMQVDHILPIIKVDCSLENMSWDEVVDRTWCDPKNLQALCLTCHKEKTTLEAKERKANRKRREAK
jgi:5-methylcytosine-specific restriction endonuclease McrA